MRGRWELTDEQWAVVEPMLRPLRRADKRGRPWHGAQWRELPERYPPFQTPSHLAQAFMKLPPDPLRGMRSQSTYSEIIPIVPSHVSTN